MFDSLCTFKVPWGSDSRGGFKIKNGLIVIEIMNKAGVRKDGNLIWNCKIGVKFDAKLANGRLEEIDHSEVNPSFSCCSSMWLVTELSNGVGCREHVKKNPWALMYDMSNGCMDNGQWHKGDTTREILCRHLSYTTVWQHSWKSYDIKTRNKNMKKKNCPEQCCQFRYNYNQLQLWT